MLRRRFNTTKILPFILIAGIIIIAIAAIVSVGRLIFSGTSTPVATPVDTSRDALRSTAAGNSVSVTVRGPIVGDEDFRSYVIDVSPESRSVKTYQGYRNTVIDQKIVANTTQAYEEFVYALDRAGLASGAEYQGDRNDTRGICATGKLYEFSILKDGQSVKTLWTTSCRSAAGSLRANEALLVPLFKDQVPDAQKLIRKVNL
jgi:hypothetical protein